MAMTDADARRFERQLAGVAGGCLLMAALCWWVFPAILGEVPGVATALILGLVAAALIVVGFVAAVAVWVHHRWFFSSRQRLRRRLGSPDEWLNVHEWRESASEDAVLSEARRFWGHHNDEFALPASQLPTGAGTDGDASGEMSLPQAGWVVGEAISGRWPIRGRLIRAPYPRSALVIGPQGSGKSQYAIPIILDLPGAALVTSTKAELFAATAALRARRGPIYVFDPLDVARGMHNFPFDPVASCQDGAHAEIVAAAMIRGVSADAEMRDGAFWDAMATEVLRCYLMAAALKIDGSSVDVQRWSHHPDDDDEPLRVLRAHPHQVPEGWLSALGSRLATNPRQRDGYFASVIAATSYLGHPGAAATVRAAAHARFDIVRFLAERSTLYVIGDAKKRGLAPLMTALTETLAFAARESVGEQGRLAEPFGMVLDEVANLTPVDLPRWTTEFRGWGIVPIAFIQSRAQLDKVWGETLAEIIWDNMITRVILGDLASVDFLDDISRLVGERELRPRPTLTGRGGRGGDAGDDTVARTQRLIAAHHIRGLPPTHALVIGEPAEPVVVAFEPGYERLAREHDGTPYPARWPRWWRHPIRALKVALAKPGR